LEGSMTDRFGRTVFPKIVGRLIIYGNRLKEYGWRESKNKPFLFYKDYDGVMIYADMRGTEVMPIWRVPYLLVYGFTDLEKWKLNRALKETIMELNYLQIPWRFSSEASMTEQLYDPNLPIFQDGSCKLCGLEFEHDGLFCSEECRKAFFQLKELIEEERTQITKTYCSVCNKELGILWW
jgi:hypothetical protein